MKRLLVLSISLFALFALVACNGDGDTTTTAPGTSGTGTETTTEAQQELEYDPEATYQTYTSGVSNMNPYDQTETSASDIMDFLTDSLYIGDYDWEKAIEDGLASERGDFSGGAGSLPYGRFPRMAASDPVDVNGDGTVWEISLREDLAFENGDPITAQTYHYSWSQLLDPLLLNDRASNLYDPTYLPLVNAEEYYKQGADQKDTWGYYLYQVDGTIYSRENAAAGFVTGTDWPIYYVAGEYAGLEGPDGEEIYVEDWGRSYSDYGVNGFVLTDIDGNYFMWDADENLIAPSEGWTLDGTAVPATGSAVSYAGALPAYMDDQGNRVAVDSEGIPVDGETVPSDPVAWDTVGFDVIDDYTFQLTLTKAKTMWEVKGELLSGITGVVPEDEWEAGKNTSETSTTYGTIDNPLISYGPYTLSTWEADTLFILDVRDNHYASDEYRMKHVRFEFIADQSLAVEEFKAGRLDTVGASGDYYEEFKFSPNLYLSPGTTFFRFAFNVQGSDAYDLNPILVYPEFRQAFYFAIDREEFTTSVRAPGYATQAFLGPKYLSTEFNSVSYRATDPGQAVLADFSPDTFGYNPEEARALFDQAYQKAIDDDNIEDGDTVSVEYKFYDVETNWKVANWVKDTVEDIFNDETAAPRFELELTAVSSDALDAAWDNGDFEMTFGGWLGLDFNAPSMLGQVYNSLNTSLMLEKGFDTANAEVTVELPNIHARLAEWIAEYEAMDSLTDSQQESLDAWTAVYAEFEPDGTLTTTYDQLYVYAYNEFQNVEYPNYDGKTADFNAITAGLEEVLMEKMIAIPLFTAVGATVYSERVVLEADEFHPWMYWGGLRYMYIAAESE